MIIDISKEITIKTFVFLVCYLHRLEGYMNLSILQNYFSINWVL